MTGSCSKCGKLLKRVPRTFSEKLRYAAAYVCGTCGHRQHSPGLFSLGRPPEATCPYCATRKLSRRATPDPIEPVAFSLLERWRGGTLYRCQFCRIQFYDRRALVEDRV